MSILFNSMPSFRQPLDRLDKAMLHAYAPAEVARYLPLWGRHEATPLRSLPALSAALGLGDIFIKDEGYRLGLGSFKALGGAYAVFRLVHQLYEQQKGPLDIRDLLGKEAKAFARTITVSCATDGNHGKSVSAGARIVGCRSVIFVHAGVSEARTQAIGADEIIRVRGTYDDSVDEAERVCAENGWHVVSDTSWPGYEDIPARVGQGYTVLAEEALFQMGAQPPTHVFLQAGVGGFAGSIAGFLSERLGERAPRIIVVEPDRAACVTASAVKGELTEVAAEEPTIMAMLECYRPSLIGWRILQRTAEAFVTVSDEDAEEAVRRLANASCGDPAIIAGESGAAGLAGLLNVLREPVARKQLGLDEHSRVLLINTETATDPDSYARIVGRAPQLQMAAQ